MPKRIAPEVIFNKKSKYDSKTYPKFLLRQIFIKIRNYNKSFKLPNKMVKTKLRDRIQDAIIDQSKKTMGSLIEEVMKIEKNLLQDDIFKYSPISLFLTEKEKPRKYDIDSIKKLLRKNIWNYVINKINDYYYIKNIKPLFSPNPIKNITEKEYEKKLMKSKIKELLEVNYSLKDTYILQQIKIEGNVSTELPQKIQEILNKNFSDLFVEYRESDNYWNDIEICSKKDAKKSIKLLELSSKFINYVNSEERVNLSSLNLDENLPENFKKNEKFYLNNYYPSQPKVSLNPKFNPAFSEKISDSIHWGSNYSQLISKGKLRIEEETKNDKIVQELTVDSSYPSTSNQTKKLNDINHKHEALIEKFRSMTKYNQNNILTKLGYFNDCMFLKEWASFLREVQSTKDFEEKNRNDQVSSESFNTKQKNISFDEENIPRNDINSESLDLFFNFYN